ncbi:DUF4245 domain-containing protein [Auritidibacter ignavus]|uniref:DUF4245 domain-containing protein n=1 Tax=Auritidibacter ignavus TaxID=678932 RepID=UPI0024BB8F68|nr:DUF4245 domain-containing protein [Auritidibacter ignavus]WHS27351.1 DUF4245 domain-containing protein [Auritidibacter ignavus]
MSSERQDQSRPAGASEQPVEAPKPRVTKSQSQRMRQNIQGIAYSVLITLVVVGIVIAFNPRQGGDYDLDIDVAATASEASSVASFDPVIPELPEDWSANYARWHSPSADDDTPYWSVGYSSDDDEFFGVDQAAGAGELWIDDRVKSGEPQGAAEILNYPFEVYYAEDGHTYLVGEVPDPKATEPVTLVVSGSLPDDQLSQLTATLIEDREVAVENTSATAPSTATPPQEADA